MPLEGFKELSDKLAELGKVAGSKAFRSAAMASMLPALRAAQAAAPVGQKAHRTYKGRIVAPGFTRRNVKRKSLLSRDKTKATILLGVAGEAFYALQFLELGTAHISKRPWLEPAFRSSVPQILQRLEEKLKAQIEKAAKK